MAAGEALDPRVLRTRRRLKRALLELIDEIGYDAITVETLTDRADVARSTFYVHFGGKDDLLFDGFEDWLSSFGARANGTSHDSEHFRFALPLLRHAATQRRFFRNTIVRGPSHRVRLRLKEILGRVALREMERGAGPPCEAELAEGRARAVSGALLGAVEWWFEEGARRPAEEVDRVFQETVGGVWRA